jgi:hypothetical protein
MKSSRRLGFRRLDVVTAKNLLMTTQKCSGDGPLINETNHAIKRE